MRFRRAVLLLAALLVVLGAAPAAAGAAIPVNHPASVRSVSAVNPPATPDRDPGPRLATFQRSVLVGRSSATRPGDGHGKLLALGPVGALVESTRAGARVDADAGARRLRASNTPCCVRGPPAAA